MIVIKLSSFELTHADLIRIGRVISVMYGMSGYPLPLTDDPLRGHQVELIMTEKNTPLAP